MRLRPFLLLIALVAGAARIQATTLGQTGDSPATVAQPPLRTGSESEEPAPPRPGIAEPTPNGPMGRGPLEASPLDTYLFRDKKGNLVPVIGRTFEELEELFKQKKGLVPPAPPSYSLDALTLSGSVEGGLANLQVSATIRVRESGWIRVPLRLNKSVLREATTYEGPGEHFVLYEEQDGYVCWLSGTGDKPHVVKLNVSLPVRALGAQSRIETILPRATESSLKLLVPMAQAEAELKGSGEGLASTQELQGKTEIQVVGAGGELALLWQPSQAAAGAARSMLEASGEIKVHVEGDRRVSSDARLLVRRIGAPLESFRVRLPPRMELVPTSTTGYTVTPVEPMAGASAAEAAASVVEIKLDRPASGTAEVRLLAALSSTAPGEDRTPQQNLEPASFEVMSAVRQRGTIDFAVDGDWSLSWTLDAGSRRVEAPTGNGAASVARFDYSQQPCGLKVSIAERPTRIAVEPTYVVFVEPKVVRLEATFKYRVRGARVQSLSVGLGDWIFARVGPETIVEVESLDPTASRLVLPLRSGAVTGEFEIKLAAHKLLTEGSNDVTFTLPRPMADMVTPASVIVAPADNVELTPRAREILGLAPDSQPSAVSLPPRQQTPLAYRDLGVGGEAKFAGQLRIRTRQTTVAAAALLQFGERTLQVEQRLIYRILYEPQRTFTLQVPRSLLRGDLKVMLGAEALPVNFLADSDGESSRQSRVQVTVPADQIGRCELVLQYSLPVPSLAAGEPTTMTVPLVIPEDEVDQAGLGQTVSATWSDALQVELATTSRPGQTQPVIEAASSSELRATTSALASDWRFQLRTSDPAQSRRLSVSKMWVQTLLTGTLRQERAAWRLSTGKGELRIHLPADAILDDVQVAVGKRKAASFKRDGNVLVLPVVPGAGDLVVEVWYAVSQPAAGPAATVAQLTPPMIEGAGQARQCYWQVGTPHREHLLVEPAGFTPELAWMWRGWFWERQGTLDQAALEQWIDASSQAPLPVEMNTYLFSAFRSPGDLVLVVLPRTVILWSIGGAVLVLGLMLLNVRAMRRPSVLLALSTILAAAGLSWPTSAMLLAQGAGVSLLVVLVAALWQWGLTGRTPYAAPPAVSTTTPIPETKSAAAPRSEPVPASTATAPLAAMTEPQP